MTYEQTERLDELTFQLSQAQLELAMTADTLHNKEAKNIVKNHVIAGAAMGLIPFAIVDIAALSTNQHIMLKHLCRHYEIAFDSHRSKLLITSLMSGSLPVLTMMGLSSLSKLLPVIGTLGGSAGVAVSGGVVTFAIGQTFINHFSKGGTLDSFVPRQFSDIFRQELKKGKRMVGQLKPDEMAEVMSSKEGIS